MIKVLIVDDEESIRFSFGSILTDAGYDVVKAADPIDAKVILSANHIDVAFVDRFLGTYNGLDLVEYISEVQPFCTTILISAFTSPESSFEGQGLEIFAYLQKPLKKDTICKIVVSAAQNSREKQKLPNHKQQLIQSKNVTSMEKRKGVTIVTTFN